MTESWIHVLLNPIPQYVIGVFPGIAINGDAPMEKLTEKLGWVLRCLGCPFTGTFYACNIGTGKKAICIYWISSDKFIQQNQHLSRRPIGIHTMEITELDKGTFRQCTGRASVLDRISSLVSVYFIVVGVIAGLSRLHKPPNEEPCEDWPYIPILLFWTIPATIKRACWGNLIFKDPNQIFRVNEITVQDIGPNRKNHLKVTVTLTAFVSIFLPWITVFLAYHTPPIGYFCRSKYLTIVCAIWSFNSLIAYIVHLKGERHVSDWFFHVWFALCGFVVALLLLVLCILTEFNDLWVRYFGDSCDISSSCQI
ncbi:1975_t:CDS:1 [Funneliformis caledonium]|uniref:1975_t:CDS:1 n=1 Tax=Funneliformis caledonium TaxID=1117310 RepID=A0A9N9HW10_9GLOM|nr:1975_t:CDS:1 [Funneliformis caledonium]